MLTLIATAAVSGTTGYIFGSYNAVSDTKSVTEKPIPPPPPSLLNVEVKVQPQSKFPTLKDEITKIKLKEIPLITIHDKHALPGIKFTNPIDEIKYKKIVLKHAEIETNKIFDEPSLLKEIKQGKKLRPVDIKIEL